MKIIIFLLGILIASTGFSQISTVAPGDEITASKINELVDFSNKIEMGVYQPSISFFTGVPSSSTKQVKEASYIRIGNKVKVQGAAYFRNDGTFVNISITVPISSPNSINVVNGYMSRADAIGTNQQQFLNAAGHSSLTQIRFTNTINVNNNDGMWFYWFVYEINE